MRWSRRGRLKRCRCGCRCRRSTSSTTAASSRAASNPAASQAGDEIVIMPAGKIAKIRTVESWPATPRQWPADRGPFGRHHARSRTVHRARRRHRSCRRKARATPAAFARAFSGCTTSRCRRASRSWSGSARARPAPPWSRSRRRSIPASCPAWRPRRSRATMSARSTSRWRSRSRPIPIRKIRAPGGW